MVETLTRPAEKAQTDLKSETIARIELDERTVLRRSAEVEHERKVALTDLLAKNYFQPLCIEPSGPYDVKLAVRDNRLHFELTSESLDVPREVVMPVTPFRRIIKDYFMICESYYEAIKQASPQQIETIDMARRGIHNEGSELLQDVMKERIVLDFDTARRLFTLICVLHIK